MRSVTLIPAAGKVVALELNNRHEQQPGRAPLTGDIREQEYSGPNGRELPVDPNLFEKALKLILCVGLAVRPRHSVPHSNSQFRSLRSPEGKS